MFRLIALLAFFAGAVAPAFAQASYEPLCRGRYALAEEMLDAAWSRFGTVYTGGGRGEYRDGGVGPTIDLWRLWQGLPDLRFRDATKFDVQSDWWADYSAFGSQQQDLNLVLRIADRVTDGNLSLFHRFLAARYLNRLVDSGSGPGWWLAPDAEDDTKLAKFVIAEAKPYSLMEWLMLTMAASDFPAAVAWNRGENWKRDLRDAAYEDKQLTALLAVIEERQAGNPGLAWWVARALFDRKFHDRQPVLQSKVTNCTATNAEFAALAVWFWQQALFSFEQADLADLQFLSTEMRQQTLENLALVTFKPYYYRNLENDAARLRWLNLIAIHSPSDAFTRWLGAGRSWHAGTVAELIAANPAYGLDRRVLDSLNVLSVDDLTAFVAGAQLLPDEKAEIVKVAAARAFVLGRLDLARASLTELAAMGRSGSVGVTAALSGPGGGEVQVALALLALPEPSVWIGPESDPEFNWALGGDGLFWDSFDLPARWQNASNLDRDLTSWLRGPNYDAIRRAHRRGRPFADIPPQTFLRPIYADSATRAELPFVRLIAFDELGQFGVCTGLTARLSEVLIRHVADSSRHWWNRIFAAEAQLATLLRMVIIINKRSPGAVMDGQPAGQVAFARLEAEFAETDAAKASKYWFYEDRGCKSKRSAPTSKARTQA